ncbi:MAG: AI-2E family transporter [Thermoanaerobaculia bacterium]
MNSGTDRGDDLGRFARRVAVVALFVIGLLFLWAVRNVLVLIFISAAIAAGIAPTVRRVRARVRAFTGRRINRGTAVLLVYFPFLLIAVLFAVLIVPQMLVQSRGLIQELPTVIDQRIITPIEKFVPIREIVANVDLGSVSKNAPVFGYVKGAATGLASIIAILFLVFYMLIDAPRLGSLLLLLFPEEHRAMWQRMITRMAKRMSYWLSGQLILAITVAGLMFVTLLALRVPFAVPLAFIAGVGELVPVIGPIIGTTPAMIVALMQSSWQFWSALLVVILIQQLENHILAPRILGSKVSVSPLTVFIAFMMGAALLGIVGAVMAIPVAAIAQVAFEEVFLSRRERRTDGRRKASLLSRRRG